MITNHGVHEWHVTAGLPDTGGQNVFVNQLTAALADLGFRITVANRGGYPHPATGARREGVSYADGHRRIVYLEDGNDTFIRKEDMEGQTPALARFLHGFLDEESTPVDVLLTHYWDGAQVGRSLKSALPNDPPHLWVPHSLGCVKKRNMPPEQWADLRVDERIGAEEKLIGEVDAIAATSAVIREALASDHGHRTDLFLPPCIDPARFQPQDLPAEHSIWRFLAEHSALPADRIRECVLITEVSRTDRTKRKDVLIEAFANVHRRHPETFLALTIDRGNSALAAELTGTIHSLGLQDHVAVLGYIREWLPPLYAATDIYCTPSVMEGFGMSIQEAAATGTPAVSSDLVPFAVEYLRGPEFETLPIEGREPSGSRGELQIGEGAIIVPANDVSGFTQALERLITDEALRREMGERARSITLPRFTWPHMTVQFLRDAGIPLPAREE